MSPENKGRGQVIDTKPVGEPVLFPEDPQARFDAYFASVGNAAPKLATHSMLYPYPTAELDLKNQFVDVTQGVWPIHRNTIPGYCINSLGPIGFVTEADTIRRGSVSEYITGFRLTEAGLKFQPISFYLLKESVELPESLSRIFGNTAKGSGDSRAVLNRAKILEYLFSLGQNIYVSEKQIVTSTGMNVASALNNIEQLAKLGLIDYSSVKTKGQVLYKLVEGSNSASPVDTEKTLTKEVFELMLIFGTSDAHTLAKELAAITPSRRVSPDRIGEVLAGLARQGVLTSDFRGKEVYSKGRITEKGRRVVERIILPVKKALSYEGEALLSEWRNIPWKDYATKAVEKHREQSGHTNRKTKQEWASDILQIILERPGIRNSEITKATGNRSPNFALNILLIKGLIRSERSERAVRYYPT